MCVCVCVCEYRDVTVIFYWLALGGFYGISTFEGYLMPNQFLYKETVLFQTNPFSLSKLFNYQKIFLFPPIQFS